MDRRAYPEARFGGQEGAAKAYRPVLEATETAGLDIAWERIARVPNTLDAHRLIHRAGIEGRQTAAVSALFDAYFRRGEDLGRHAVLADVAGRIEMDCDVVARLLATAADRAEIAARDAHARERGVTGVSTFVVGQTHAVAGAQPPDLWRRVLDELVGD